MASSPALQAWEGAETLAPVGACIAETLDRARLESADFIAQWDALARNTDEPNPFFESWFLGASLDHFGQDDLIDAVAIHDRERLIGLMPIGRRRSYYGRPVPHLASWTHPNAFCDMPLVAQGYETAFWSSLLEWADCHAGHSLFLHLAKQPADTRLYKALSDVLEASQRSATIVASEERAMLTGGEDPEAYYTAALSNKRRKELRRQAKRLSELGDVQFERSEGTDGLDSWISTFLAIEQAGWKGANKSSLADHADTAAFFDAMLHQGAAAGRIERLTMTVGGKPIAMLVSFLTSPGSYSFKTTYDEAYSRFSPGVLLQKENLALLQRDDIDWCDSCAAADHPMIDRMWTGRRTIRSLNIAIGGPLRRSAMQMLARLETGAFPKGIEP